MKAAIIEKRIKANLAQIEALRKQRDETSDNWLEVGIEKTEEICEAISEQIVSLYEENDDLEAGVYNRKNRTETRFHKDMDKKSGADETPNLIEAALMKRLGWTLKEVRSKINK